MKPDLLEKWKGWAELLFPLLIFAVLYLVRRCRNYRQAQRLREIAPLLNGEAVLRPFSAPAIRGIYMGHSYRMSCFPSARNSPGRLQIFLGFPCGVRFEVVPKEGRPGVEELLFRKKRVAVADDSFNATVVVREEKEWEKASLYLDNPRNRELLVELVDRGFRSIRFESDGVTLIKEGDFLGRDGLGAEKAMEYLTLAGRLLERF